MNGNRSYYYAHVDLCEFHRQYTRLLCQCRDNLACVISSIPKGWDSTGAEGNGKPPALKSYYIFFREYHMMHKKRRNRVMSEVEVETLRAPTRNATGEEVMESDGDTHDDNGIRNSSERTTSDGRISFDGDISQQTTVNLCSKKKVLRIGTWNVRTMDPLGKLKLLLEELDCINLDIVGLCETRWNGEGKFKPEDDTTIVYSEKEKGKKELGVAIILRGEPRKLALDAYTPVSDRIIAVRLKAKPKPMTIIQVYAPTSLHDEETIDRFYEQLQETSRQSQQR